MSGLTVVAEGWLIYAALAAVTSAAIHWFVAEPFRLDVSLLTVPWLTWVVATAALPALHGGKTFANVISEALWLGCSTPLASIVRLALRKRLGERLASRGGVAAVSAIAMGLWASVPLIPE
jgi:hypothetical protein